MEIPNDEYWFMSNETKRRIKARADVTEKGLIDDGHLKKHGGCLTKGTPEWVSWHRGYVAALRDVLRLIDRNPESECDY